MTTELVGIYTKKVEGDTSKQWTISGFFVHRFRIERKIRFFVGRPTHLPSSSGLTRGHFTWRWGGKYRALGASPRVTSGYPNSSAKYPSTLRGFRPSTLSTVSVSPAAPPCAITTKNCFTT